MNKCLTSAYVGYIIFYNYLLRYNKIYVSGMLMIRSMTGFGRATAESEGYFITVEIKSVNHRYFDFNCRLPRQYGFAEENLKSYINSRVSRGKVDCFL